jgi:HAD superfamily hydrolase (TIGR01509 family)
LHWDFLRGSFPIFARFDGYVVSHEAGLVKPDSAIYRHLATKFNSLTVESILIDDLRENVEAAENVGFAGFQFDHRDGSHLDRLREILLG